MQAQFTLHVHSHVGIMHLLLEMFHMPICINSA